MEKQFILFILFSLAIVSQANGFIPKQLFQSIFNSGQKVTQLQVYVQDILSGPNPTVRMVASANSTFASPTLFGLVSVLDDPVRTAPNPNAQILGRAQGLFVLSSLEETSIHMAFDIVFTSGQYTGSTLNLAGRNPYQRPYRELSVVGGTGAFLLGRGRVGVRTVFLDSTTGDAFFQYNITVLHN